MERRPQVALCTVRVLDRLEVYWEVPRRWAFTLAHRKGLTPVRSACQGPQGSLYNLAIRDIGESQ